MDEPFYRDLFNHWTRCGSAGLVEKRSGRWYVRFADYTVPTTFKTRKAARDFATEWVVASSRGRDAKGHRPCA